VAAIARYHRRSLPKKRHESWQLITDRQDRRTVGAMALLLRLAAALDRRPVPQLGGVTVTRTASDRDPPGGFQVILQPSPRRPGQADADLSLERWSLGACAEVVREATGLEMEVVVQNPAVEQVDRSESEGATA
jgi:exopolyphosphatase/guanosine-5'-triphosphate,3'-diphosphate pyrophosphatase